MNAAYPAFFNSPAFPYIMAGLTLWDLFWRGKALWRASKQNQLYWFIALLVVNSLGILPIIYLVFFSKGKKKKTISIEK